MLLAHLFLFLHFSLVFAACNGTSRHRRPQANGVMKAGAQQHQSGGQSGVVLPANSGSLGGQSGSNHIGGGQLAANQVAAGQAPSSSSSSAAGSTPTGNPASNPASKMAEAPASGDSSGGGGGMKASFTQSVSPPPPNNPTDPPPSRYGPCSSAGIVACGWYSNPGYNAAVPQSLFGTGPGGGAGPACGQCFQLNPDAPGTNSIVVKVNNLCPADGNPLCSYDKCELSYVFILPREVLEWPPLCV